MVRKIVAALILVPIALAVVLFAVANRQVVSVVFDPFDPSNPAFAMTMPLFLLVFVLVGLGIVIGGLAAWLKQHKWRVRARRAEAEERRLRREADARGARPALPPAADSPPVVLPPAA